MTVSDRVKHGASESFSEVQSSDEEEPLSPKVKVNADECTESQSNQCSSLAEDYTRSESKRSSLRSDTTLSESVRSLEKQDAAKPTDYAHAIVCHVKFRLFINSIVALNMLELGISSDATGEPWITICTGAEHIFTAVFVVEMVLKLMAFRCEYFTERMNVLDFVIAWIGVVDMWCMGIIFQAVIPNLSVIRILRLLRITRIAKLFSAQHQLYMLVQGISASLWSLIWIGCLLLVVNYTSALVCVQLFGKDDYGDGYLPHFSNSKQFGTVPNAMLSLFNIVLVDEWTTIIRPIYDHAPWGVPFMVMFVVLTACGLLNVMIGVIVEKCAESRDSVQANAKRTAREQQMEAFESLTQILKDVDFDGNKRLSLQEAKHLNTNSDFMHLLDRIDLPKSFSIDDLFLLLTRFDGYDDHSGEIHESDFINGMLRLLFSNEFQHTCMLHLSLNEIKQEIHNLQKEMRFIHESHSKAANEIKAMRAKFEGGPVLSSKVCAPHESRVDNDSQTLYGTWEAVHGKGIESMPRMERQGFEPCNRDTMQSNIRATRNLTVASSSQQPDSEQFEHQCCAADLRDIATSTEYSSANVLKNGRKTSSQAIGAHIHHKPAFEFSPRANHWSDDTSLASPLQVPRSHPRLTATKDTMGKKGVTIGKAARNVSPSGASHKHSQLTAVAKRSPGLNSEAHIEI